MDFSDVATNNCAGRNKTSAFPYLINAWYMVCMLSQACSYECMFQYRLIPLHEHNPSLAIFSRNKKRRGRGSRRLMTKEKKGVSALWCDAQQNDLLRPSCRDARARDPSAPLFVSHREYGAWRWFVPRSTISSIMIRSERNKPGDPQIIMQELGDRVCKSSAPIHMNALETPSHFGSFWKLACSSH